MPQHLLLQVAGQRLRVVGRGADEGLVPAQDTVREDRIVQTFTWEGMPNGVSLETLDLIDLGDGRTRLHAMSLCDSFEDRDAWLSSGMEHGVNDGYAALEKLAAEGELD